MSIGLIGRKVGMTQVFQDDGTMVAVSVRRHRAEHRDACCARPSATATRPSSSARTSPSKLTKPELGPAQGPAQGRDDPRVPASTTSTTTGRPDARRRRPVRGRRRASTSPASPRARASPGTSSATTSSAVPKTHGSDSPSRSPAPSVRGTTPGRVYKGMRMAGHMGDERATIKKVRVVRTDAGPQPAAGQGHRARARAAR